MSEVDQPHRNRHIIPTEVVTKFLRDPQTGALTVLGVSILDLAKVESGQMDGLETTHHLRAMPDY